jgi:hypothetical protein
MAGGGGNQNMPFNGNVGLGAALETGLARHFDTGVATET